MRRACFEFTFEGLALGLAQRAELLESHSTEGRKVIARRRGRGRMTGLEERVAIVTGAAGGLGKSICATLQDRGASVLGVDVARRGLGLLPRRCGDQQGQSGHGR